ncbi:biliverdin-producing heme oxygenase [Cupriavidus plantarum]|nr:biliverdin-producing heme oxygenase [Cupriavidus plantarum]NYI00557.1 heme oxygenase [Cupriavidus plantarum]
MTAPQTPTEIQARTQPEGHGNRDDILAALRAATSARHATLDRAMPLSQPEPTLRDYRDHLLLIRAWLAPLETWFTQFDDGPQDPSRLPTVHRVPTLDADLAHPAIPPGGPRVEPVDTASLRTDAAYRWGIAYVIEGSQLGGAVLYRQLAERFAPHPLQYLGPQPPGPRWKQFLDALRASVRAPADIDAACEGACRAFDDLLARTAALDGIAP